MVRLIQYESGNITLGKAIFFRQFLLKYSAVFVGFSNFISLFFCKLCPVMIFATDIMASSLGMHIYCVISNASKKQMIRPYASWIVASVADQYAFRNIPNIKHPRSSIGTDRNSLFSWSDSSVSVFIKTPSPYPTLRFHIGNARSIFVNKGPKSFGKAFYFVYSLWHFAGNTSGVRGSQA